MTFAIGDIQGCYGSLLALLAAERASPPRAAPAEAAAPAIWLCGDLVNRGRGSLATLRWAMRRDAHLVTVLGNHDLHLLALAAGVRAPRASDTLRAVLAAPDLPAIVDWLRRRPLAHLERDVLLVHAGVLPAWSAQRTVELAREVQAVLASGDWRDFLAQMYGDEPDAWDDALEGAARLRVIVNALTRLRLCTPEGRMEFRTKESAAQAPPGFVPWFEAPGRRTAEVTVVFGHWSTLGLLLRPRLIGLDSGCVWGGRLSGVRLEDRALFQVPCPRAARPGSG